MDRLRDTYLKQMLKNWATRISPPASGRARLLCRAALQLPSKHQEWLPVLVQPEYRPLKWVATYSFWRMMQPYDSALTGSRLVL